LGRTLNVFRIAAGLRDFPHGFFKVQKRDPREMWRWVKAQAREAIDESTSVDVFAARLRSAREKGLSALYRELTFQVPFLVASGSSLWIKRRIEVLERLFG
jgi:hypothetical protein